MNPFQRHTNIIQLNRYGCLSEITKYKNKRKEIKEQNISQSILEN